jgi:hypothetical protein
VVRPKAATWLTNQDHSQEGETIEEYCRKVRDSCSSSSTSSSYEESTKTKPLQKFRAIVRDWADQELCSKPGSLEQSLVFGIFQKKTRQEQQQFPEPSVPPNFDPHHIFTKEEEDHLDALLVSFQNDLITNASKDAPTTTSNNRSNIDYYVNTPSTPLPLLSLNDESPISSTVKDDLALALNQRFSSSTATPTTVTQPEKPAIINQSSSTSCWKRKIFSFQPTHLLCKRFLLPTPLPIESTKRFPTEAVHTSNHNPFVFATSSSLVKAPWNYDSDNGPIPKGKEPTHVNVSSIISKSEPANASISFLKSIFEPSNDAVSHYGCGKAKNVDSLQTYDYRDMRKTLQPSHSKHRVDALESIFENIKQNQPTNEFQQIGLKLDLDNAIMGTSTNYKSLHAQEDSRLRVQEKNNLKNSLDERVESSSSSRIGKSSTNNSFKDTSTHTSSSSSEIRKDVKRKRRKSGRKESLDSFSSCSSSTSVTIGRRHRRRKGRKRERAEVSRRSRKHSERDSKRKKKKRSRKK